MAVIFLPTTLASADNGSIGVTGAPGGISYSGGGGTPGSGARPSGPAGGAGPGGVGGSGPVVFYAQIPVLVDDGHGGSCIAVRYQPYPTGAAADAATLVYEHTWLLWAGRYPLCPGAPAAPAGPLAPPSPAAVAASYWSVHGEDMLARPDPVIAPGYALAGKPGYLETRAPLTETFRNSTPLGDLVIAATGRMVVDWGDGSGWQGPFADAGGPWPTGQITHVWDNVGRYDVVVREQWSATWHLAGASGALTGIGTEGSIPGFEVRQLQSIRNR